MSTCDPTVFADGTPAPCGSETYYIYHVGVSPKICPAVPMSPRCVEPGEGVRVYQSLEDRACAANRGDFLFCDAPPTLIADAVVLTAPTPPVELAFTGSSSGPLASLGLGLVLAGSVLVRAFNRKAKS